MNERPFPPRPDRPWPIVALAGASWLPLWAVARDYADGKAVAIWLLLLVLTLLPLPYGDPVVFRRTCLTIGGLLLATEFVLSLPYLLLVLPFFIAFFPAGVLLLLAGWRRGGRVRTGLAAVLGAFPFVITVGLLCHPH
ncbi:hypothetical protein ACFVXG_27450 [Kitasatospora sp. NPDC058162]|uniref:hypothetical protein n=1 Tax=Kitasatospora sp. NPDC058162 TaxID=3346362 RepID=UPI0036D7CE98